MTLLLSAALRYSVALLVNSIIAMVAFTLIRTVTDGDMALLPDLAWLK